MICQRGEVLLPFGLVSQNAVDPGLVHVTLACGHAASVLWHLLSPMHNSRVNVETLT
jgi:hypothetical protein